MVEVKQMPHSEKYAEAFDVANLFREVSSALVREQLGEQAALELETTRQQGVKSIPEDASVEQKYELAYANWIWTAKTAFSFIREQLGEEGIEQYGRAIVEAFKRKNASPALSMLRLVSALSPGYAFALISKRMAYRLQWMTPYSVSELTHDRAVFDIPQCKVLGFPDVDDICIVGCHRFWPMWVAEQFGGDLTFDRQGNSCTCTVVPLT